MKKLITVLIGCSLALAVSAAPEQQNAKKKPAPKQQPSAAQAQPKAAAKPQAQAMPRSKPAPTHNAAKAPHANVPKQQVHPQRHVQPNQGHNAAKKAMNQTAGHDKLKGQANAPAANKAPKTATNQQPAQTNKLSPDAAKKSHETRSAAAAGANTAAGTNAAAGTSAAMGASTATRPNAMGGNKPAAVQKPDRATVQNIRSQHTNFHATPSSNVSSVQFNQDYRIAGAQNWSGTHYEAFRSYQPTWHDRSWWDSHYHSNILLIGGGWYFWNAGFWYPAWGYDTGAAYYPYDGPIYTGSSSRHADQVIADVQAVLQHQGFYQGEVDGLLGPLTRDALAAYQDAEGLERTAAIDQPTLESLGLT
jgi:hypothetical protein